MNLLVAIAAFVCLASSAFAADAPPPMKPPPAKPPTIAELQAQVEAWHDRYVMAAQDRDQALAAAANLKADLYAAQQATVRAAAPPK